MNNKWIGALLLAVLVAASVNTVMGMGCKRAKMQLECGTTESAFKDLQCWRLRNHGLTSWTPCSYTPACPEGAKVCASRSC